MKRREDTSVHPLAREDGFTLAEMMVTMVLMVVVLFALYNIFDMSIRVFSFGNNKVESVESARVAMERMEREIRSAHPRNRAAGDRTVIFNFATGPQGGIAFGNDSNRDRMVQTSERISYEVDGSALRRRAGSSATADTLAEPLRNDGLSFTYFRSDGTTPAVTEAQVAIVRIRVAVDVRGRVQTLETDVALRNRGV
ncbi:prepilin-type N-terminal cleavage/methylation domain-containing protein [Rubrobacter marinus]|uniref:prepilin-type N-terminal cleavage/methylation domain-containing protein n=1 Tax=Rubrobacter marinus TaxID=2653852 RepID=UPI001409DED8|nr:prepilin-type N-terminal cleavage/methylation domain-containing protein [Rubrobacter marinus]